MRITLATLLLLLTTATTAQATSTIGQLATSTHAACKTGHLYLQAQSAAGEPSYTVPTYGALVTSWSQTPLGGEGSERLVVVRPATTAGQYTVVAMSPEENVTGSATQIFPVHIAVQSGDLLGLDPVSGSFSCEFPGTNAGSIGDLVDLTTGNPQVGETLMPGLSRTEEPGERLNVTATVEPDADHDGYGDSTEDACPTDPSTRAACPIPLIIGTPAVGQTLQGTLGGLPENPSYAWLRCSGAAASCYAIPGETGLIYRITSIDIGHTLRLRQTASNEQDTQITESAPTAPVSFATTAAVTPQLSSFTQSAARWREGVALAHYSRKTKPPPIGTTFRFVLNLPSTVTMVFSQKASGRLLGGKCVAPTKHNEHKHTCARTVNAGELRLAAHVGHSTVTFQGRLSSSRKLSPGRYTVTISAGSSGRSSAPKSLSFTILAH
ncbi:MAG TPA: hypothetical protein VID48_04840 [Solirubrobacteraceae bacterium]|jgi:hypothetical protein